MASACRRGSAGQSLGPLTGPSGEITIGLQQDGRRDFAGRIFPSMSYWSDKVAVITGGSRGLGFAIASAFASAGARIVVAARDPDSLARCESELRAGGADVTTVVTDVTQAGQIERMVSHTVERYGRLDVLVNNVGHSMRGDIAATAPEVFEELMGVNFLATVRCTHAALPHLLAARGHLVNIGSLAAKIPAPHLGAYPATKFAVAGYTHQLRLELEPRGLHVLLVCPGPILHPQGSSRYDHMTAGLPDAARQPGGTRQLKPIPPAHVAKKILRYCQRRKPELVIPGKVRLLLAVAQLSPSLADKIIRR
ncbi:MAG: SDR family oxidoreductase [Planctomycetales bacterium]|nr:SDR family oxidoreductase [Planctomycetales bacterium]NIP69910.1 SDR family oxidoreductase [Planctomycetales bacterium]